jgi:NADH dehydrogenase (ubiquinone) flavoprotein 2
MWYDIVSIVIIKYSNHALMTYFLQHRDTPQNNLDTQWDFTSANYEEIKKTLKKYPPNYKRSAVMPLLFLAQKQSESMPEHGSTGWIPLAAMNRIASVLDMPPMRVYEVATFYTMYNRNPIGKHNIQVCTTSPCMVCGAYDILTAVKNHLGVEVGGKYFLFLRVSGFGSES